MLQAVTTLINIYFCCVFFVGTTCTVAHTDANATGYVLTEMIDQRGASLLWENLEKNPTRKNSPNPLV